MGMGDAVLSMGCSARVAMMFVIDGAGPLSVWTD